MEPILKESNDRFTVFPIKYNDIWDLYEQSLANFWTVEEIDFSKDLEDWGKLSEDERYFIKNILAFFAASDGIVNENLVLNFYKEVQISEMRQFYASQIMIEAIHNQTYSLLIETYVKDAEEKKKLFNALDNVPIVKKKADWVLKWMDSDTKSFSQRLIGFIITEGIFFSGSFCAIYWLKSRNLLPGLTLSNEFISRDEALHCKGGIALYSHLENKLTQTEINVIFKEAVELEQEFITVSLPVSLIGMNKNLMKQYIEYVADYWLINLGYTPIYNSENPFDFMIYMSLQTFGNFFETRISSYKKAGVGASKEDNSFSLTEDF